MNYWIFQSNPCRFPIIREVENAFKDTLPVDYRRKNWWGIPRIPRRMRPDDIVFIWKSDGGEKGTRGIYAKAKIISAGQHIEPVTPQRIDAELKKAGIYLDWIKLEDKAKNQAYPTVVIEYIQKLLQAPLLAQEFAWMPELKNLVILKFYQKILYDDVTEEQGRILEEMVEWNCKAELLRRNASRVSSAMNKFSVSLPKISLTEAQLQAAKLDLTLNDFIIRAVNRFIRDEKVYEETQRYGQMGDGEKIAYLKNFLKERREIGIARYGDEKNLDDAIKSGDYKLALTCHLLHFWLLEKYELVYPTGYKW